MTREEACDFIRLYKMFSEVPVKIVDFGDGIIELEFQDQNGIHRDWYDDWAAAKVIANN